MRGEAAKSSTPTDGLPQFITKVMQVAPVVVILRSNLNASGWSLRLPRPGHQLHGAEGQSARNTLSNRAKMHDEARFKILRLLYENAELTR